jgi:OOP family OmpA-OmpF porin
MIEDERTPARLPMAFWAGVVGAGLAALAGLFGVHNGSVWRLPAVLQERVETALQAGGYAGLEVRMSGQRAVLRGVVDDESAIAAARHVALTAAGAGGGWAGGVTSVDASGVAVGRVDRPYAWSAQRGQDRVVLAGAAPSEAAQHELLLAAQRAFPNADVVDGMHVAGGAPSPRFTRVASDVLRGLARLGAGEARIADAQIVFIGDGGQEAVDALNRDFANPPAPFRTRMAVTVDGLDLAHPELQGLNLQGGDAETCAAAFGRLLERNVINFAPGSAAIDPSSRQLLDSLASVALRCDRFTIEVAGHTDDQGGRDLNMELSRERAEAVASYLASQGVARSRLNASGYGPDRPRASNATPEGQATNRRIEFNVTG